MALPPRAPPCPPLPLPPRGSPNAPGVPAAHVTDFPELGPVVLIQRGGGSLNSRVSQTHAIRA